ncbi:MAG: aldehyde:ferredoxin oxidoreductase [Chloroflexi bacterium]|nr:MAG: aldehyde:ferredoxin oxidoreductase [Chloroflexota bacterium]
MFKRKGYHGVAMLVDLDAGTSKLENIPETILRQYIGGTGLGAYFLNKYCKVNADPFGPENPLIFVTSPLVGTKITTSSKFAIVTKSPLTGFIGDSLASSYLAVELKACGFDALIIRGKCDEISVLKIEDHKIKVIKMSELALKDVTETENTVKNTFGKQYKVACIGPAGENLVRFASVSSDGGRQAGRTGVGAVMGSKRLKAIAVKGSHKTEIYDPSKLAQIRLDLAKKSVGTGTEKYRTLGTISNVSVFNRLEILPTNNFQFASHKNADAISAETLHSQNYAGNAHCANCTIGCQHFMSTNDSGKSIKGRVEYESAFALGSLVGISDPNVLIRASSLCDQLGLDTISTGVTVAWAIETMERGLLSEYTSDHTLSFGDGESLIAIIKCISQRKGLGNLLAEGTMRASRKIGNRSEEWAMHVKGLEMPGYEPRGLKTMALALAVSTRGACHNRSSAYESDFSEKVDRYKVSEDRGRITAQSEDFSAILDSMIWCKFIRKAFNNFYQESVEVLNCITGWDITVEELIKTGERINNSKKLFNIREGWQRPDDILPKRIFQDKLHTNTNEEMNLSEHDLNKMIESYYSAREWNKDGTIPHSKILELNLDNLGAKVHQSTP